MGEGLGLRNRGIAVWEEHLRQRNIFWNYTKHKTHSTPFGLITIIIDQEAEQSVKLMIDSVAAAELDNVRKRQKEVVQV